MNSYPFENLVKKLKLKKNNINKQDMGNNTRTARSIVVNSTNKKKELHLALRHLTNIVWTFFIYIFFVSAIRWREKTAVF